MQIFQGLDWLETKTRKMFIKNPRRSVSAIFRFFRNHPSLSAIGDYPVLTAIIKTALEIGIWPSRYSILYSFNQSEELKQLTSKEKTLFLDSIIEQYPVQSVKQFPSSRNDNSSSNDITPPLSSRT